MTFSNRKNASFLLKNRSKSAIRNIFRGGRILTVIIRKAVSTETQYMFAANQEIKKLKLNMEQSKLLSLLKEVINSAIIDSENSKMEQIFQEQYYQV